MIDYTKTSFDDEEVLLIRKEYEVVRHKYPHHVPIVVRCKGRTLKLSKTKFLISEDATAGQLLFMIRKKIDKSVNASSGLFLLINNKMLPSNQVLAEIYHQHKDEATGMLFVTLCQENIFGFGLT
jgi:hypothetical protein